MKGEKIMYQYSQNSNSEDVANFIRRRKANLRKVFHSF